MKFSRIRHYGFLSNAAKTKALAKARASLKVKAQARRDKAARREAARERLFGQFCHSGGTYRCPCCKEGTMQRIGVLPPLVHQAESMTRAPPIAGEELKQVIWVE